MPVALQVMASPATNEIRRKLVIVGDCVGKTPLLMYVLFRDRGLEWR